MNKSHIILYQYRACSPINALRPLVFLYIINYQTLFLHSFFYFIHNKLICSLNYFIPCN